MVHQTLAMKEFVLKFSGAGDCGLRHLLSHQAMWLIMASARL